MRILLFCFVLLLGVTGGFLSGGELVRDETRLLPDEQRAGITARLSALREKTGVEVCVVALTYGGGVSVRRTAAELANARGEDCAAVVLLHNRGVGESGLAVSRAFWRRYPADEVTALLDEGINRLQQTGLPHEERVLKALDTVLERVPLMESRLMKRSRLLTRQDRLLGAAMAAGLVVLLGLGWSVAQWCRGRSAGAGGRCFPDVEVGLRLGAAYGGGVVAEARAAD